MLVHQAYRYELDPTASQRGNMRRLSPLGPHGILRKANYARASMRWAVARPGSGFPGAEDRRGGKTEREASRVLHFDEAAP